MKHTPGPWKLDTEDFEVFEQEGGMICTVRHPQDSPCIDVGDDGYAEAAEACEANAHLIAAAPDLLVALKDMVRTYHPRQCGDLNCVCTTAAQAIAKAEGRQ